MKAMAFRSDYNDTDKVTLGVLLDGASMQARLTPADARKLAAELTAAAEAVEAAVKADAQARIEEAMSRRGQ